MVKNIFQKNKIKVKVLKILPAFTTNKSMVNNDALRLANISTPKELDEYVVLHSSMYEKIFKRKKMDASRSKKQLSVVKVCYEGKSIHRAYLYVPASNFNSNYIALTPNSINELICGKEIDSLGAFVVCRGCRWIYYWHHPNAAVRMSFRIGLFGIFIAILLFFIDKLLAL